MNPTTQSITRFYTKNILTVRTECTLKACQDKFLNLATSGIVKQLMTNATFKSYRIQFASYSRPNLI